jgi:hypothetical protein
VPRQDDPPLLLGPPRCAEAWTSAIAAATDLEPEPDGAVEGDGGAAGLVGGPEGATAHGNVRVMAGSSSSCVGLGRAFRRAMGCSYGGLRRRINRWPVADQEVMAHAGQQVGLPVSTRPSELVCRPQASVGQGHTTCPNRAWWGPTPSFHHLPDMSQRRQELPAIIRRARRRQAHLVFLDESGFILTPTVRRTLSHRAGRPSSRAGTGTTGSRPSAP